MSSESVRPHTSLTTPPSWGCHQPPTITPSEQPFRRRILRANHSATAAVVIHQINNPKHGSAMLVRNDIVPSRVKGTVHAGTELIAATFENITITSIYIPPPAKLTFSPDFFDMNQNNIIIGDFNSHNHLWGYRDDNENGLFIEEWISTNNHLTHDSKLPNTFNSGRWKQGYNPDLACVSQKIRDICHRRVYDHISRSQHRPHGVAINPHDHPFGTAFPPPLQLQKGQLGIFHHYPWQWHHLSGLAIVEGIQILQLPSSCVCPQMHPSWLHGKIHIRPSPRIW